MSRHLYFFAIVPPFEIADEITKFKEEADHRYNARHALKSPPHITLVPPFWMQDSQLKGLDHLMEVWSGKQSSFYLTLNGFDCFPPRVIFVANEESKELSTMQDALSQASFAYHKKAKDPKRPFHPHMTIAFKDLKKSVFKEAWLYFSEKKFQRTFKVDQVCLLVHKERKWHFKQRYFLRP